MVRGHYKKAEHDKAADLLRAGVSVRMVHHLSGLARRSVEILKKSLIAELPKTCECGGVYGHHGWCAPRFSRSPKRQALIQKLTQPKIPSWQRPTMIWLGQTFNPMATKDVKKTAKCSVRECVFPVLNGVGEYCFQHNHFFDYGMTMHDQTIDVGTLFTPKFPHMAYELAPEIPRTIASLERSLTFVRRGVIRNDHKNIGDDSKPTVTNYGQSPSSGRRRVSHGKKKIRLSQRRRGAGWKGSRQAHDPRKRWTRETLEAEANSILGESPIDVEYNFIPLEERGDEDYEYESYCTEESLALRGSSPR